ncbi:MAG: hypothetical protein IJ279_02330 [Clostridia bacterium]|nr:hypothetical protein [Clostridia bacterium]
MNNLKRYLSVILAIVTIMLGICAVSPVAAAKGDINGDGSVTVSDAMLLFNHVSGKKSLGSDGKSRADVNSDGSITVADAMKVYNIILGKDSGSSSGSSSKKGEFKITTYGWGHDVGMSQNGANLYAKNDGMNYKQILAHYYPGTKLVTDDTTAPKTVTYNSVEYSMRNYLASALYMEMGPSMHKEALKAQCVAIYTFGKYHSNFGKNFNGNDHAMKSNVASAPQSDIIFAVVDEVMGQYLTYNGKPCLTVYSATSAGTTAKCSDIWYQDLPYLTRVPSKYDSTVSGYKKTITYTKDEMKTKLESKFGVTLSGTPENWVEIISHDSAVNSKIGHALTVSIDGKKTIKGADFYVKMGLRSPCYTVEYV